MSGEVASHLILFITAVLLASSASAVMLVTIQKVSVEMNEQGVILKKILGTDFEIINDPADVVYNTSLGAYIFYIKNTGSEGIYTTNKTLTVLLNGINVNFVSDKISIDPGETATLYVFSPKLNTDAKLTVITDVGVKKTFEFRG